MKKLLLTVGLSVSLVGGWAQTDVSGSLDFVDNGITYTITDLEAKTCRTKSGSATIDQLSGTPKIIVVYGNTKSGNINIPSTVTRILDGGSNETYTVTAVGDYAFNNATTITLPGTVTSIGEGAFAASSNLTTVDMGDGVVSMGNNVFASCTALSSVNLSNSLTALPPSAFISCSALKSIKLPESLTTIGEYAFENSGLESVVLPSALTQLGVNSFSRAKSLREVTFPENLTAIPANAFNSCTALTSVTLPASVTSIGEAAFRNCISLTEVTVMSTTLPVITSNTFSDATYNGTLKVYNSLISSVGKSPLWSPFKTVEAIYVAPQGVTISKTGLSIYLGMSQQLTAALTPAEAVGEIKWSVSSTPENAVVVSETGRITAQRIGSAVVTASCGDYTATCQVTVIPNSSESVTINPIGGPIYVGNKLNLSAIVRPATIITPVTWASSNPQVATIDPSSGELTAVSPGGSVISATCEGITGKLSITVNPVEAASVTLDKYSLTLKAGDITEIKATVLPENTTYPEVTWETSDPNVAVAADGYVTALGTGSCTIRAYCGQAIANCEVIVEETLPETILLSETSLSLKPGQIGSLSATVLPATTTDKTVYWTSSETSVATVDMDGNVNALAVGTAVITASCGNVSSSCLVTVDPILADEVVLNYTSLNLLVNQTQQLVAQLADNVTDKTITWKSSDETIVTVNAGLVTAVGVGSAVVTAYNGNISAECMVTVSPIPVESISLDVSKLILNVSESAKLLATITPADATDPIMKWGTSNPSVATVYDGTVTAVAPGTATIYVTSGINAAYCVVTVNQPATSISLNYTSLSMEIGEMEDIIATVAPANTTDIMEWKSSDPSVVSVNEHGIVEALAIGSATITATCGSVSVSCVVTVIAVGVDQIILNSKELNLMVSESYKLTAMVMPENATDKTIVWSSSNDKVASVSDAGVVTAVAAGTAVITAKSGNVTSQCSVSVTAPAPTDVIVSYSQIILHATETFQLTATVGGQAGDYNFTWKTGDSAIATVSEEGLVTAVAPGETNITVSYGGNSAVCLVTVTPTEATLILLDPSELTMAPGDMASVVASVYPTYTTDQTVVWSSDNETVATVDSNGLVTAKSDGYAVIIARCGNAFAQCIVTVSTLTSEPGSGEGNGNGGNGNGDDNNQGGSEGDNDNGEGNGEGENGIEGIVADEIVYNVYTITGMKVLSTKEKSDLDKLSSGIYIINGQKVYIRK